MTHRPHWRLHAAWIVVIASATFAWQPSGRTMASPHAPLAAFLGRANLPDGDLMIRWIDVEGQHARLGLTLGDHHPLVQEAARRALVLQRAAESASSPDPAAKPRIAAYLERRLATIDRQRIQAEQTLGPNHPRMRRLARMRSFFTGLRQALGRPSFSPEHDTEYAQAVVERADQTGRLGFLETRYTDKHPRVLAARAALSHADAILAGSGHQFSVGVCNVAPAIFERVIVDHSARVAALAAGDPQALELSAGLDSLIVERAAMRAGCRTSASDAPGSHHL